MSALIVLLAVALARASAQDKDKLFGAGVSALESQDAVAAKNAFSKAITLSPGNATLWEGMAAAYTMGDDLSAAADSYAKAVLLEPTSVERWHTFGFAAASAGAPRLEEAVTALHHALKLPSPGDEMASKVASDLGIVFANLARPAEAELMLHQASTLSPSSIDAPLQLGRLLAVLPDRRTEAMDYLSLALRRGILRNSRGEMEDIAAQRERAASELRKVISRQHLSQVQQVTQRGEDIQNAAKTLELRITANAMAALAEHEPHSATATFDLAQVFALSNRHQEAEHVYHQARALAPSDRLLQSESYFNAAVVVARQDRPAEAAVLYRSVLELQPLEIRAQEYLGDVLLRMNAQDEARDAYQRAADIYDAKNESFRFLLNFHGNSSLFWIRRNAEAAALDNQITNELMLARPLAGSLSGILNRLRNMEINTTWQVARLLECARAFGAAESTKFNCGYGISWFDTAWQPIMAHPLVAQALETTSIAPGGGVLVLGSALGEHCLFTSLLLGVRCVGHDLLCETNVDAATSLVPAGAPAEFRCEDASNADLRGIKLVWLLDVVWPTELQKTIEQRLAAELLPGAVVVMYRSPAWRGEGALLAHEAVLDVEVSWRRQLPVTFLEKRRPGGPARVASQEL